jgi:hypothetical protein
MLRARMGIRAHPTLTNGKTSKVILAPTLAVAPGSPFVHLGELRGGHPVAFAIPNLVSWLSMAPQ